MNEEIVPINLDSTSAFESNKHSSQPRRVTGRACLDLMMQRGAMGLPRLSPSDREKLAAALFVEVDLLKRNAARTIKPFSTAGWMAEANLAADDINPTKRLNEYTLDARSLTLDQYKDRAKKLNARYAHYASLIQALLGFTTEDADMVCSRIFNGTSFESGVADITQCRPIVSSINELVVSISKLIARVADKEDLETIFARTAKTKERLQKAGSVVNWPYIDLGEPHAPCKEEVPNWERPYWDKVESNFNGLADPRQGHMLSLSLDWLDALMYLPRAYLGCAVYFPDWDIDPDVDTQRAGIWLNGTAQYQNDLGELRTLHTGRAEVAWRDAHSALYRLHSTVAEFTEEVSNRRSPSEEGHCWLVIYPARLRQALCPMLYWSQGQGGVHVCPLDEDSIYVLSHFCLSGGTDGKGVITLFDSLRQMLWDESNSLELEWARTVFDVLKNPILISDRNAGDAAISLP
jgi:hypothetical protein